MSGEIYNSEWIRCRAFYRIHEVERQDSARSDAYCRNTMGRVFAIASTRLS